MKVMLGWMNEEHGTVEISPSGELDFAGPDPERVRNLVEAKRRWHDRPGVLHILTDEELVRSLPYRMQGHLWAVFVDPETGLTQEQPAYDPWGDTWNA
jgi:hypothetical protein